MTDDQMPMLSAGLNGGPSGPVEGYTDGYNVGGGFAANAEAAFLGSLGNRAVSNLVGAVKGVGQPLIPRDKAAAQVKAENLDPAFIGDDGITPAALATEMTRQTEVKLHQQTVELSRSSTPSRFVSGLLGGLADPLNLALMLLAPAVALPEAGLAGRVAMGAAEGAAYNTVAEAGINHISGHDPDTLSWETVRSAAFGMLVGGAAHGALGPRPEVRGPDLRDAGNAAIIQAAQDSAVNVTPILDRLAALKLPELDQVGAAWPANALARLGPTADIIRSGNMHLPNAGETVSVRVGDALRALDKAASLEITDSGHGLPVALPELVRNVRLNGMDLPTFLETNADRLPANAGATLRNLQEAAQYADTPRGKEVAVRDLAHYLGTLKLPELERGGPNTPVAVGESLRRLADRQPSDLSQAVPKPGSALFMDPEVAKTLDRIEAGGAAKPLVEPAKANPMVASAVPPEATEIQKAAADAVKEAEHAHAMVTDGLGDFKTVMAHDEEANASDAELAKAIDAAVRCGAFKGLA